jgi:hypothetical protein
MLYICKVSFENVGKKGQRSNSASDSPKCKEIQTVCRFDSDQAELRLDGIAKMAFDGSSELIEPARPWLAVSNGIPE